MSVATLISRCNPNMMSCLKFTPRHKDGWRRCVCLCGGACTNVCVAYIFSLQVEQYSRKIADEMEKLNAMETEENRE